MVTIPNFLREPIRKSFSERASAIWRENPTETGAPIRRKLYDNAPSHFKVMWILDETEAQAFDGWFKLEINQGASSFDIPLYTPSAGVVPHDCQFASNPVYKFNNRLVRVSASLTARFKKFDTDENIQDLLDTMQDLFDAGDPRPSQTLDHFSQFMQVTLPDEWADFL